jgi:large subunit ribosomal protein L15
MKLHNLKPASGSTRSKKVVGRGPGSGRGGTSTRGHKGAQSRSGYKRRAWFEGGQMPLYRRIPKFGFKNPFRVEYHVMNLDQLQKLADENSISEIDHNILMEHGILSKEGQLIKVLGRGELTAKLEIKLNKFSASAKAAIEAAGGTATEV